MIIFLEQGHRDKFTASVFSSFENGLLNRKYLQATSVAFKCNLPHAHRSGAFRSVNTMPRSKDIRNDLGEPTVVVVIVVNQSGASI